MSDYKLNTIFQEGTNTERLAFTPSPATETQLYIWGETDTGNAYWYNQSTTAWVQLNGSGGGGGGGTTDFYEAGIPAVSAFTAFNNSGVTVTENAGKAASFYVPNARSGSIVGYGKAIPSGDFTIMTAMSFTPTGNQTGGMGVFFKNSGTGKILTCYFIVGSTGALYKLIVQNWDNATTYDSEAQTDWGNATFAGLSSTCLALFFDGTNYGFGISPDGAKILPVYTVNSSGFVGTPDTVGFHFSPGGGDLIGTLMLWDSAGASRVPLPR